MTDDCTSLVFASLTANDDEFFSYLDIESAKSCSKALDDLDSFIDAEGPFDAVMAFSQGAGLAATLMLRHSRQNSASPFKLAIFFSGGVPADPELLAEGIVRRLDPDVEGEVIHTPTAHIYGSNDHRLESDSQNLSRLCSVTNKTVQIHNGGHEIPGLKVREAVPAIVRAIKKVMEKTLSY